MMPSDTNGDDSAEPRRRRARSSATHASDGKGRIRLAVAVFALAYLVVIVRLVMFGLVPPTGDRTRVDPGAVIANGRPDLVDRHGQILATDIRTASLYAEPRNIFDPDEAAEAIAQVFPDLDPGKLRDRS